MARITLSPLAVDVRGKQSDTVFSKWRGRNYVRSRVTPHNPQTASQQENRAAFAALAHLYATLPTTAKLNLEFYAKGVGMTGSGWFIKKNLAAQVAGDPISVCEDLGYESVTEFRLGTSPTQGCMTVDWEDHPVPTGNRMVLIVRKVGTDDWEKKEDYPSGTDEPMDICGLVPDAYYDGYLWFYKDVENPTGEEVGESLHDRDNTGD